MTSLPNSNYLEYKTTNPESQVKSVYTPFNMGEGSMEQGGSRVSGGFPVPRGLSYDKQKFICFYSSSLKRFMYIELYKVRYEKMRRSIVAWANYTKDYYPGDEYRRVMITLTYEKLGGWLANDVTRYIKDLKVRLGHRFLTYAWVAELQKRGAIHYHIVAVVKKGTKIPLPDKSRMWKHGMSSISTARSPFYLITYLKKEYQKNFSEFPKGSRCFGIGEFDGFRREELRFRRLKPWEQAFLISNKMNYQFLRDERENRKRANQWEVCYVTDDYSMVKNVYDGFNNNGLIDYSEQKETSCQWHVQHASEASLPLTASP